MMVDESLNKQEIALYDYSQYKELKSIYANNITVSHICEKLSYFNINDSAIDAKTYMEENNYDYLGIEENGIIMGYINRSSLGNGIGKLFSPPRNVRKLMVLPVQKMMDIISIS